MKETYKREDGGGTWHNKIDCWKNMSIVLEENRIYQKSKRTLVTRAIKDDVSLVICDV